MHERFQQALHDLRGIGLTQAAALGEHLREGARVMRAGDEVDAAGGFVDIGYRHDVGVLGHGQEHDGLLPRGGDMSTLEQGLAHDLDGEQLGGAQIDGARDAAEGGAAEVGAEGVLLVQGARAGAPELREKGGVLVAVLGEDGDADVREADDDARVEVLDVRAVDEQACGQDAVAGRGRVAQVGAGERAEAQDGTVAVEAHQGPALVERGRAVAQARATRGGRRGEGVRRVRRGGWVEG